MNGTELILDADGDTTITSDTDDRVDIKVAGTDTVHVNSSGIGIKTTSGSSFTINASSDLVIGAGSGNSGMTLFSGTSSQGAISFADGTASDNTQYRGYINYAHNLDALLFGVSGTESMRINSIGAVTKPLQPAFCVQKSAQQANFSTGSFVDVVFDDERFDQNADFSSNTFTAPVTGRYQLGASIMFINVDTAANYYQVGISTSNHSYFWTYDPGGLSGDINYLQGEVNLIADMDANDTAKVVVYQNGGTAQTDISYDTDSVFSGFLVC
jgi:hypothetical protein